MTPEETVAEKHHRQEMSALGRLTAAHGSEGPRHQTTQPQMAGRCYTGLRQPHRAEPLLVRALNHYDKTFAREVSFYASWLAECYVQTEDIDEAARQASRALALLSRVNSTRATARASLIRQRLRPYRHVQAVAEFEELWRHVEEE
jgi:hypothetical protein